ncbi:MAG: Hsp20/alpha crystallin family protein [Acidobacteriota bacterium]
MNTMTPITPLADTFDRSIHQLFDAFFQGAAGRTAGSPRSWRPAVDIRETENAIEVLAELPGMKKDDIGIQLDDNALTLRGSRTFAGADDDAQGRYRRVERAHGTFSRTFALPVDVDADAAEARFEDGILAVTLPKAAQARARRIDVR